MDQLAPGIEKENSLRAAGFSEQDIESWKADTSRQLLDSGFNTQEIDGYFGVKPFDNKPIKDLIENNFKKYEAENLDAEGNPKTPRHAMTLEEAFNAGFQTSVTGLIKRGEMPDTVLPEDAPMFYRIASSVGQISGDIPAMVAGSLAGGEAGAVVGGVAGSVIPGAGTAAGAAVGAVVGAGYGSFAVPEATRQVLMQYYEKGEVKDANDFWERAASTFIEANKAGITGAATAGVGGVVGKVATKAGAGVAVKTTAQVSSEVATMVTVGKGLEGELPEPQDFIDAAILVGGMHGAGIAARKMRDVYAKTGMKPEQVVELAQKDATVKQELLTDSPGIPKTIAEQYGVDTKSSMFNTKPTEPGGSKALGIKDEPPTPIKDLSEANQKIRSQISEKLEVQKDGYTPRKAYKDFVDKFDPINQVQKVLTEKGEKLSPDQNPYQLARQANDYKSKVKYIFEKGNLDYKTLEKSGKSFQEILKPVTKDLEQFEAYVVSKRALEVEAKGKTSGFDVEAAKKVVLEGKEKYEVISKELVEFQNKNIKYARDAGILSSESYKSLVEAGRDYTPFKRILEPENVGATGGKGKPSSLKEFKGSSEKIQSPILSILENTEALIRLSESNRAKRSLVELAEKSKDQVEFTKVKKPTKSENEFEFYRNGEKEVWRVENKDVAQAIKFLDGDVASTNLLFKIARGITAVKRLSISIAPDFMIKNFFRDQITASTFSHGRGMPFIDSLIAMKDIVGKSDNYYNWLKSGGAGGTFLELNQRYLQKDIFKLNRETGLIDKSWNVLKKPVDFLHAAASLTEQATRLAEFKRAAKGATSGPGVFEAGFAAREITIDFSRIGAKMSALNSITAFQNVSIQGLDRTIRALKENPVGVGIRATAYITVPSIWLWWANKDDERYKELPRWQKDLFWIIPTDDWQPVSPEEAEGLPEYLVRTNDKGEIEVNKGIIYRIPKPQELGILFGSVPERALEKYFTDNPNASKDFDKTMMDLVTPAIVPDAVAPKIEQWANKSLFSDSKIVPGHLEKVAPEYQYTEYTTESAKQLAKMVKIMPGTGSNKPGELSVESPMVIENYVRAWSGNLGMYALQAADKALIATGETPDPVKPASTLADIPVIKAFVVRYPSASAQNIQDFYDNYEKQEEFTNTIRHLAKSGEYEEVEKLLLLDENQDKLVKLDGIKNTLTANSQWIRLINKNPDLTPDEKRQLIDGVYYMMIQSAKDGNKIMEELNKELGK